MEWLSSFGKSTYKSTIVRCYPEELPHFSHALRDGELSHCLYTIWIGMDATWCNEMAQVLNFLADEMAFGRLQLETCNCQSFDHLL